MSHIGLIGATCTVSSQTGKNSQAVIVSHPIPVCETEYVNAYTYVHVLVDGCIIEVDIGFISGVELAVTRGRT
jgi:hypothetical protein